MSDVAPRTLNHFSFFSFEAAHLQQSCGERRSRHSVWLNGLRAAADMVEVYQVYPSQSGADILVWSAVNVEANAETEDLAAPGRFFEQFARATNPHRGYIRPGGSLWGFTKPSQYTKTRSPQEMDPFADERRPYLIAYPFSKTSEWYLMSREARQGMMNEHIRIGKQYPEIKQLLLYSFGLQDHEFVVVYETQNLGQFSDLVNELRSTEARRYTLKDTPIVTAVYHRPEETLALWEG